MSSSFDQPLETTLDHAWAHFSYHAQQRLITVRFFLVIFAILFAGCITLLDDGKLPILVGVISLLCLAVTLIFKRMDNRNVELIELSEEVLIKIQEVLERDLKTSFGEESDVVNIVRRSNEEGEKRFRYGRNISHMFILCMVSSLALIGFAIHSHVNVEDSNADAKVSAIGDMPDVNAAPNSTPLEKSGESRFA